MFVSGPNPPFPEEFGGCHGFLVVVSGASVLVSLLGSCVPVALLVSVALPVSVVVRLPRSVSVVFPKSVSVTLTGVSVVTMSVILVDPVTFEVGSVEVFVTEVSLIVELTGVVVVEVSLSAEESVTVVGDCVVPDVLAVICDTFPGL